MVSLTGMYRHGVVALTAGRKRGDYGGWVEDWDNPTITALPACTVQPETTREIRDGATRVVVQSGWKLITRPPHQGAVKPGDRIRVPGLGQDLDVVGTPQQWDGMHPHTEVDLEVING